MDQDLMARAIRVATTPGASAFDWWESYQSSAHKDHALWRAHPQRPPSLPSAPWTAAKLTGLAEQWPLLPEGLGNESGALRARRLAFRELLARAGGGTQVELRTPYDDERFEDDLAPELMLQVRMRLGFVSFFFSAHPLLPEAPDWLWAHGDLMATGFTDEVAVYHLLYTNKGFALPLAGSHAGKVTSLQSPLALLASAFSLTRRVLPQLCQWLARPGMPSMVLNASRPFLAAAQGLVDAAAAAGFAQLRTLLGLLASRAALSGHVPVFPRFSCAQHWIAQDNTTQARELWVLPVPLSLSCLTRPSVVQAGYRDHKVVDDGVWCVVEPDALVVWRRSHSISAARPGATRRRLARWTSTRAYPTCTSCTPFRWLATTCCAPRPCCTSRRTRRRAWAAPTWLNCGARALASSRRARCFSCVWHRPKCGTRCC